MYPRNATNDGLILILPCFYLFDFLVTRFNCAGPVPASFALCGVVQHKQEHSIMPDKSTSLGYS